MLTVADTTSSANAARLSRRKLLQIGSLGLGGLALPALLASRAAAGQTDVTRGKSVIFLFQQGGPSQLETFDPKPDAPQGGRTVTDTISTSLPGVAFGSALPQLAKLADRLTIVRSFQTENASHNIEPVVGPDSLETNIGTHFSRIVGATRPDTGMPTNAVIYPASVCDDVPRPEARGKLTSTGSYGDAYAAFVPGAGGQLQEDMKLNLPRERFFDDRRRLLSELDRLHRQTDSRVDTQAKFLAHDELRTQAYQLLLGDKVASALDLSREDPATLAAYDTGRFVKPHNWNRAKRGQRGYYTAHAKSLGKLLLQARRLCEAGCGFVTIHAGYAGVWDMHGDGNNLDMKDGMQAVGSSFDHAVAAFIKDTEDRGLSDDILLVTTGEMGRTPRINKRGGRDHWSRLAPLMLYGGGLPAGRVIGQSTRDAGEPATNPVTPKHLISTILHTLIDVGELRLRAGVPPQITQLAQHDPIPDQ